MATGKVTLFKSMKAFIQRPRVSVALDFLIPVGASQSGGAWVTKHSSFTAF